MVKTSSSNLENVGSIPTISAKTKMSMIDKLTEGKR